MLYVDIGVSDAELIDSLKNPEVNVVMEKAMFYAMTDRGLSMRRELATSVYPQNIVELINRQRML